MDLRLDYGNCEIQLTQKSLYALYRLRGCISYVLSSREVIPPELQAGFDDFYADIKYVIEAREDKRMTQVNPPAGDLEIGNLEEE
jgi:hypothetical protein